MERYTSSGGHKWDWFWETDNGNVTLGGFDVGNVGVSCCGTWSWKVQIDSNHYAWHFYSHPGASGPFNDIGTGVAWDQVGMIKGIPEGETNRRGGNCTGMSDDQWDLQFQNSSGWHPWNNNTLDYYQPNSQGVDANWSPHRVNDTEYQVTRDPGTGC